MALLHFSRYSGAHGPATIGRMDIKRGGSQPSGRGPAEWFTGAVRVDPLFQAPDPARVVGASVTFEPGARTAWHTHPLGQTLIVTAGCGRAQRWGGPIEEIRPGDVIWFAPGEKHWHGAAAAAGAAVDRFGRIDVLVNNAANFFAGYFEELTPEQIERQVKTALIGPMNVTRAVLPVMRKQRSGHIISISSGAGLLGFAFCSAYAASKFGLEGWMESLQQEVAPFGITTTIVNPGFFRTELLEPASVTYAEPSIEDYADRTVEQLKWWQAQSGKQGGDPAKLARALVTIASEAQPPRRFIAGADAIALAEQHVADLQAQIDAHRELSTSLALDEPALVGTVR